MNNSTKEKSHRNSPKFLEQLTRSSQHSNVLFKMGVLLKKTAYETRTERGLTSILQCIHVF